MSTVETTTVEAVRSMTNKEMVLAILDLQAQVKKLTEASAPSQKSDKEMSDDDARNVLNGELRSMKHKDAAQKLGLSYGQVYSCRGQFTFKHIHKELAQVQGYTNPWIKA
jgi:hypothetical protein